MELLNQSTSFMPTAISTTPKKRAGNESVAYLTSHHVLHPAPSMRRPAKQSQGSGLPTLELALDQVAMTSCLRARLCSVALATHELKLINIELLDCKPSKRALIRYELANAETGECYTVLGKLYADSTQLARVHQVMDRLWTDVFAGDIYCSVPQPLGVLPELSMLLYLPAEGQFLDEVLTGEQAAYAMELTGRWLATLHNTPLPLTKQFHLSGELTNLAAWADIVGQTYPELAMLAQQALHYLHQQATRLPLATQTPIHKDFHYRHVLVERGIKVIDFDELRLGDPNFDLAHFCANLHLLAYRRYGSPHAMRTLEQRFFAAYARNMQWALTGDQSAQFTYFYVYTCLKLARQLCLGFGPSPIPTAEERRSQVYVVLNQASVAIRAANKL
ncbi:hypothetical protein BH10CHL1_BH10CHL1_50650 [soil metagenome]